MRHGRQLSPVRSAASPAERDPELCQCFLHGASECRLTSMSRAVDTPMSSAAVEMDEIHTPPRADASRGCEQRLLDLGLRCCSIDDHIDGRERWVAMNACRMEEREEVRDADVACARI